jgi:hypothetical protein
VCGRRGVNDRKLSVTNASALGVTVEEDGRVAADHVVADGR